MKKITNLLTVFFLVAFGWQGMAQVGGDSCTSAEVVIPGTFNGTTIVNGTGGASQGDAADAKWFSYTATADGTIDVSSCLGGSDTRLWVWDGTCAGLNAVANNDDACDLGNGSNYASEVTGVSVTNGTTYYIEWDDRWEDGVAFNWSLTYTPPPSCLVPTGPSVTAIVPGTGTNGTATISWVDANTPASAGFEYEIVDVTAGGTPTGVATGTTGSGVFSANLTGLLLNNDYSFLVRADCGLGNFSAWSNETFWTQTDPPTCTELPIVPADGATGVSFGSTLLTWTEDTTGGPAPTGYQIWFGQTSGALTNLGTIAAPATGINITGIVANTTYYWRIVPENGGGEATGCAEYSYTTKDYPPAPVGVDCAATGNDNFNVLTEEFDAQGLWTGDITTGATNGMWNFAESGGTTSGSTGPDAAQSGTNYMYYEASGGTTARASAVTPAIDLTGATGGAELSFYMHAYGTGMGTLEVGVGTSAAGPFTNEFTWVGAMQSSGAEAWQQVGVILDAYVGQTIYIEVAHTGTGDFQGDMAIDLFNVETCLTLSCVPPANLAVTNISAATVDIAWDVEPTATNYDWEIQPAGSVQGDPGAIATGVNEASNSVAGVVGPYTEGLDYTLFVRSNCGLGSNSNYSSLVFSIPPLAGGDDCTTATVITEGIFYGTTINAGTNGGSQAGQSAQWFSYTPAGDGTIDVSSCLTTNDTRLYIHDGTCAVLNQLATNDDSCGLASEILGTTVTGGTEYFIEWDDRWSTGPFDWSLTFTPAPTCLEPTNLMVTDINPINVDIAWDVEPGAIDGYRYEIQLQGVAQGTLGAVFPNTLTLSNSVIDVSPIGGFSVGTTYTLYVNSVCTNGVDESTYASVDFFIPYSGNCGLNSNTPNVAIPDNDPVGVTDVMTAVSNPGEYITDLNVYIGITHTWTGDLTVTLTSPSGTSVDLITTASCGSEDNFDIELDDEAVGAIVCGTPGVYQPANLLSAFDGEILVGDWSLTVTDAAGGDTGTLDQWCLIPTLTTISPNCATGSDKFWEDQGLGIFGWTGGAPTANDRAFIAGNYNTTANGNIDACELWIDSASTLTVTDGNYINIQNDIVVGGILQIQTDGSVVQANDLSNVINANIISLTKNTPVYTVNGFSIISNPMTGGSASTVFIGPQNPVAPTWYQAHTTSNFVPHPGVEMVYPGVDNWADDNGDDWNQMATTAPFNAGEGYLVGGQLNGQSLQGNYAEGTLNNGVITYNTTFNTSVNDSPNILGNPYASAIDINTFLTVNPDANNTVYFWERQTAPSPSIPGYNTMNFDMGDISNHNGLTGNAAANGGPIPTQFIPSGQGFGIKPNLASSIIFDNSMRVLTNNVGYRSVVLDELHLMVTNETYNLRSNTAIAFTDLAVDGIDKYDSKRLPTMVSLYSLESDMEMGIQTRAAFNTDQLISLGFTTLVEEEQTYTISIRELSGGLIEDATVYLRDTLLNIDTNLSENDYTFTANVGDQQGRFIVTFRQGVLGNTDITLGAITLYPNPADRLMTINSPFAKVNNVVIHDISGRVVATFDFTNKIETVMDLSLLNSAIYFVEINTNDGSVTKRIIKE